MYLRPYQEKTNKPMNTPLTNEQKIDEIYSLLKSQQRVQSRAFWYRIFKWCLILGVGYFTLSNPGYVAGKLMDYISPIVTQQVESIVANKKNGLIDQVKKIIPQSDPQPQEQY